MVNITMHSFVGGGSGVFFVVVFFETVSLCYPYWL
jgi:hypothetical protein